MPIINSLEEAPNLGEFPVLDHRPSDGLAVFGDTLLKRRQPHLLEVRALDARLDVASHFRVKGREVVLKSVGDVVEGVSERAKFPVENRDDLNSVRKKTEVPNGGSKTKHARRRMKDNSGE